MPDTKEQRCFNFCKAYESLVEAMNVKMKKKTVEATSFKI